MHIIIVMNIIGVIHLVTLQMIMNISAYSACYHLLKLSQKWIVIRTSKQCGKAILLQLVTLE